MNNPGFIHEQVAKRIANVRFIITSDSWWKKIFNEDIMYVRVIFISAYQNQK